MYGIELWGTATELNIENLHRRDLKVLTLIAGAPW